MKPKYRPVVLDSQARAYIKTREDSPRTQQAVRTALQAFYSFRRWHKQNDTDPAPTPLGIKHLDNDVLIEFNNWLLANEYSPFSRDNYCTLIGGFLAYAQDKEWTNEKFSAERSKYRRHETRKNRSYPIPKVNPLFVQVLTYYDALDLPEGDTPEIRRKRLDILRGRAAHKTLYATAGRVSEVAVLTRKQTQGGRRDETEIVGKGDKERILFFTPEAQDAIQLYLAERQDQFEPVFINHKREVGHQLSRQMLWHIVHFAADKVGAVGISPHDFRHYRARQMLAQGAPLAAIQEILGHADIGTTRKVYAHYDKPTIRAIFERTSIPASELT